MRSNRSTFDVLTVGALIVAIVAILLLPLLRETDTGGGAIPIPVGPPRKHQFSYSPVPLVPGRSVSGAAYVTGAKYGGEDEPYGKFLWAEASFASFAMVAALLLSISGSLWARIARTLILGLALVAIGLLSPTLRQTVRNHYQALRPGFSIAVAATVVALVASAVAMAQAMRANRPNTTRRPPPDVLAP